MVRVAALGDCEGIGLQPFPARRGAEDLEKTPVRKPTKTFYHSLYPYLAVSFILASLVFGCRLFKIIKMSCEEEEASALSHELCILCKGEEGPAFSYLERGWEPNCWQIIEFNGLHLYSILEESNNSVTSNQQARTPRSPILLLGKSTAPFLRRFKISRSQFLCVFQKKD